MSFTLHHADCRTAMLMMDDNSVDAVVTDPPYELGFMGKKWDNSGIAYDAAMWAEVLRILRPGGHVLAFSGSRTYHRMAVAIEDAGFEIRDQIMWLYGSGFPKSHDVSKGIDKAAGAEREVIGRRVYGDGHIQNSSKSIGFGGCDPEADTRTETAPATPEAERWQGWGTALKPAHEPIVLARKPLVGTVAQNVLEHGTGALNIDGCRIGTEERFNPAAANKAGGNSFNMSVVGMPADAEGKPAIGRWPANVMHDGSDEVVSGFPNGEARFFYCSKASRKDRNSGGVESTHPTVKPTDLMRYLCRLITPPGGTVFDPFTGSGSTGKAALLEGFRFIGCEMTEEYIPIATARLEAAALEAMMS